MLQTNGVKHNLSRPSGSIPWLSRKSTTYMVIGRCKVKRSLHLRLAALQREKYILARVQRAVLFP
jgi:hypothetical protein